VFAEKHGLPSRKWLVVVSDDLAWPFAEYASRRGLLGHNGLKSIILDLVQTNSFVCGRDSAATSRRGTRRFVLASFPKVIELRWKKFWQERAAIEAS